MSHAKQYFGILIKEIKMETITIFIFCVNKVFTMHNCKDKFKPRGINECQTLAKSFNIVACPRQKLNSYH
jgi:hypothetical protein